MPNTNEILDAVAPEYLSRKFGADPLIALIQAENNQEIQEALTTVMSELKPSQQEILSRYVRGQSINTIANEINRSVSTVYAIKNSIVKRLRQSDNVKDALSKLANALRPLDTPLPTHKTPKTDWLFELQTQKKGGQCRLKKYLNDAFGDDLTVCTLCKKCR